MMVGKRMCIVELYGCCLFLLKKCNTRSVRVTTKWRWKGFDVGEEEPTKNYIKPVLALRWVRE